MWDGEVVALTAHECEGCLQGGLAAGINCDAERVLTAVGAESWNSGTWGIPGSAGQDSGVRRDEVVVRRLGDGARPRLGFAGCG